jgi:putative oxidoreductase
MTRNNGAAGGLAGFLEALYAVPSRIPDWFLQLGARVAVAPLFFISGRGKVAGFTVTDSTIFLFEHEFGLPMPVVAAHLAALAENLLPIALVVGFATRLSALALFVMTIVIQFVYPGGFWNHHILWFFLLLFIMARGPGCVSLDHLIARKYQG